MLGSWVGAQRPHACGKSFTGFRFQMIMRLMPDAADSPPERKDTASPLKSQCPGPRPFRLHFGVVVVQTSLHFHSSASLLFFSPFPITPCAESSHGQWQLCCLEGPTSASFREHFNSCPRLLESPAISFFCFLSLATTPRCGPALHRRSNPAGIFLPSQSTSGLLPSERRRSGRRGRRRTFWR